MFTIHALTGDSTFLLSMQNGNFQGVVHSVFNKVVNIVDEQTGKLCFFVSQFHDNGPRAIRVSLPGNLSFRDYGLVPGTRVIVKANMVRAASLQIDLSSIRWWEGRLPDFPYTGRDRAANNVELLAELIGMYGKDSGLKSVICAMPSETQQNLFSQKLLAGAQKLLAFLKNEDIDNAGLAARQLLGLGCGQTPAGDDFCAGLITVMNMPHSPFGKQYQRWGHAVAQAARRLTTAVSCAMLENAADGQARESVLSLLAALNNTGSDLLKADALRVLAVGSTSGTDLAIGIAAGMRLGLSFVTEKRGGNYGYKNCYSQKCLP